jgi:hypothetical protein
MRKLVIAVIASTASTMASPAESLLQCVKPDILNGILFFGRSQEKVEVKRGLPAALESFRTPAEFSLIGTGVSADSGSQTVSYKTAMPGEKAYLAMAAALGVDGWAVENTPDSRSTFNVEGAPRYGMLCRNSERRMLSVTELSGVRYANINLFTEQESRACNAPQVMDMGGSSPALRAALPRFQFPAGSSLAQGSGGGGSSSGSSDSIPMVVSSTRVIGSETPATLEEILHLQLKNQGWQVSSNLNGNGGALSSWSKTIDGRLAWGTLEVVGISQGTLDVDFTMTVAPR